MPPRRARERVATARGTATFSVVDAMVSSGADRRAESGRVVRVTVVCATASARRASGETTRDRTRRTRSRGKKAVGGSRKRGHLIHSAPSRGSSRRAQESFWKRRSRSDLDFFVRGRYFRPIRSRSTADRDRERRSNARGERTTASTEPVRARSVPAQRTASRRSEGSEGERGCVCRGGRRGAVPPGCRIANGLARRARGASSDRAGRADSGREKAPTNVSPRDRRRPRAALD